MSGRSQRVFVHGVFSRPFDLNCGVPQGSCLGPLLFIIYVSKLFKIVEHYLPDAHCFADDTQLYLSFKPLGDTAQADAIQAMEKCIDAVRNWMIQDRLLINDDKTEFLLVGTRQQLEKLDSCSITVGNNRISPSPCVKNLGSWFDSNLKGPSQPHLYFCLHSRVWLLYFIRSKSKRRLNHCETTEAN